MSFLQTVIIPSSDYAGNDVLVQASLSNQVEYAPLQTPNLIFTVDRHCNDISDKVSTECRLSGVLSPHVEVGKAAVSILHQT